MDDKTLIEQRAGWARQYRHFAALECPQDPLYVAICLAVADSAELLDLMVEAPSTQRRPNLLLAALHERVLAGAHHPLAGYYPSVGGEQLPDAELPALLLDFARREREALLVHLRGRSTQTNECGRCAVLWPALRHIAAQLDAPALALLDLGSSAGLNLGVDAYRYDYGAFQLGAPPEPGQPLIRSAWRGAAPAADDTPWCLVERLGLDPAPIDVEDEAAVRWLRACLWPHDRERAQRLEQALVLARRRGQPVRRAEDCLAAVEPWLDGLPAGVRPVLFNSWVLAYFDVAALARYQAEAARLARERGLVWLSAEASALRPPGLACPPTLPGEPLSSATLWSLQWATASGELRQQALAWSHPHGSWLHWLAK